MGEEKEVEEKGTLVRKREEARYISDKKVAKFRTNQTKQTLCDSVIALNNIEMG